MRRLLLATALLFVLAGCSSDDGPTASSSSTTPYFQRLTYSNEVETAPRLSPDGTKVAYERGGGIRVMELATHTSTVIVPQGYHPSWTRDGAALVFVRRDVAVAGLLHRLMKITLATGRLDTLSADSIDAYEPAVSPVDDRIVLRVLSRNSLTQSLRILGGAGQEIAVITKPGTWSDMTPSWTNDGEGVVFVRLEASGVQRLMYVPAMSGNQPYAATAAGDKVADPIVDSQGRVYFSKGGSIVTSEIATAPRTVIEGPGFALSPTLSNDRTKLVFTTDRVGNRELWMLVDPNGINPIRTYNY
jgi:Tol biopolymer transport system component